MAGTGRLKNRTLVAHCDWGKDPRKRWMAVARRRDDRWTVTAPEPVGEARTLLDRLAARAGGGGIIVGFDFPIGLPEAYGRRTGFASFPEALAALGAGVWSAWYDVCEDPTEISLHRPFYPMRPGGTSRLQLLQGLGLTSAELHRICERATPDRSAASMLFWTLGGNQVGKGAITGWRDVIAPSIGRIGLWPFHGTLASLDASAAVIITETYPGEVYGHLGILRRTMGSKRSQEGRRRVAGPMLDWLARHAVHDLELSAVVADGFTPDSSGEDRFDAFVGLLGMVEVIGGRRPEGTPAETAVGSWEGWILGQLPPPVP